MLKKISIYLLLSLCINMAYSNSISLDTTASSATISSPGSVLSVPSSLSSPVPSGLNVSSGILNSGFSSLTPFVTFLFGTIVMPLITGVSSLFMGNTQDVLME